MASGTALLESLTPSPEELAAWKGLDSVDELDAPVGYVQTHLQLAAALFLLASDITEAPDPASPLGLVVRAGVLDMAWNIGTSMEDRDAQFSPFSSESIGSYRYSKMQQKVSAGEETGVPFFDQALKWIEKNFSSDSESVAAQFGFHAEQVYPEPYGSRYRFDPEQPYQHMRPSEGADSTAGPDYIELFESGGQ